MTEERVQRRLAAIVAADIVGYSRLMDADEEGTLARMKKLRDDVIDPKIIEYGGRIFKTTGDGFLAEFPSAVDAVRHAVEFQRSMIAFGEEIPENRRLEFRVGISLGDVMVEGDDLFGNGVNIASRMEGLAETGGICVSENVHEHVGSVLDVAFEDLGDKAVKNIEHPIRCYRVHLGLPDRTEALRPRVPGKPSIAVLPFENLSADPEQEYFADGLSEDLITDLSKISGLFVVARNSSFAFKGKNLDVREIAVQLNVAHVLEGSVRKMGSKVRINAQLIESNTGGHLWAERYDGDLDDIFTLQDEIMAQIVAAMELHLTSADRASAAKKQTESVEAYDLCLRGRAEYYNYTPQHIANARRYFEQALNIDPTYADAYGYLSYCLTTTYVFTWPGAEESLDRALELAEKSLALDPRSSVANARLGWVLGFLGQFEKATECFERAITFDPRDAGAFYAYGETMNRAGDAEKAIPLIETAIGIEIVPPPGWEFALGHSYVLQRKYDDALGKIRAVLDRLPRLMPALVQLARLYAETDRISEARRAVDVIQEAAPRYTIRSAERMFPYADAENRNRLRGGLHKAGMPG